MARRVIIENTLSGKFKDVLNSIFELFFGKYEIDIADEGFELDFRDTTTKFYEDYIQTGLISFTKHAKNSEEEIGHIKYIKITTNGGSVNYSSDFTAAKNDYVDVPGEYDFWFVYLPDGQIQYTVIARP